MTLRWACCSLLAITQLVVAQSQEAASSSEPCSHPGSFRDPRALKQYFPAESL